MVEWSGKDSEGWICCTAPRCLSVWSPSLNSRLGEAEGAKCRTDDSNSDPISGPGVQNCWWGEGHGRHTWLIRSILTTGGWGFLSLIFYVLLPLIWKYRRPITVNKIVKRSVKVLVEEYYKIFKCGWKHPLRGHPWNLQYELSLDTSPSYPQKIVAVATQSSSWSNYNDRLNHHLPTPSHTKCHMLHRVAPNDSDPT